MDGERQRGDDAGSDAVDGTAGRDSRQVVNYLVRPEAHSYIAIMDVLEKSVTDLTPAEITAALVTAGQPADRLTVEARLDQLRAWGAVSARTDATRILRYADLVARNWRWTATPVGRQAQRFYRTVLAGTPVLREIPLTGLNRIVTAAETLARAVPFATGAVAGEAEVDLIGTLFTAHDDLDGALVGAEDALAALADRFDLDDDATGELKGLVVDYATRVAAELDTGSARAARALETLAPPLRRSRRRDSRRIAGPHPHRSGCVDRVAWWPNFGLGRVTRVVRPRHGPRRPVLPAAGSRPTRDARQPASPAFVGRASLQPHPGTPTCLCLRRPGAGHPGMAGRRRRSFVAQADRRG